MRIVAQKFVLVGEEKDLGKVRARKQDVKVDNITTQLASQEFRSLFTKMGYKDDLDIVKIPRGKNQVIEILSIFNKPIKCSFSFWQAQKDTEKGRSNFFVGKNSKTSIWKDDGVHILVRAGDKYRLINRYIGWYGIIVTTKSFKEGRDLKEQDFVEFLLVPLNEIVKLLEQSKHQYIVINKEFRKTYAFDNMFNELKEGDYGNIQINDV